MGVYAKIFEHRRLAAMLLSLLGAHVLLVLLAVYAVIRFQQFWAVPAVLWLLLIIPTFRKNAEWLWAFYLSRDADVLAANGLVADEATGHKGEILANVCEEIALATGEPQPAVAICQSEGINAFSSMPGGSGRAIGNGGDTTGNSSLIGNTSGTAPVIVFTSAMADSFNRQELQAVAADLYAHRHGLDRLFFTMAGAMYLASFAAADVFLVLTTLQWHYGSETGFSGGPLVVILSSAMLGAPLAAARLAQVRAMRKVRFLDDLEAVGITMDLESMESALEKTAAAGALLDARYDIENAHFYFTGLNDPARRYPWQKLATHPPAAARVKAVEAY